MTAKQIRTKVEKLASQWMAILGLHCWEIALDFTEHHDLASCVSDPEYEQATLYFNVKRIKAELTADQLEELVVHELVHCLTVPPDNMQRKDAWNELQTTRLGRSLLRARDAGKAGAL